MTQSGAGRLRRLPVGPSTPWALGTWLVAWAAMATIMVRHVPVPETNVPWSALSYMDYRDTLWTPIKDYLHGNVPYDPVAYLQRHPYGQGYLAYLPSYWWFWMPMLALPYKLTVAVWAGVTTFTMTLLADTSLRHLAPAQLRRRPWLSAVFALFLMLCLPGRTALTLGQWATLCATGAVVALLRPHDRKGWVVFATMVAMVKPPVGLPLLGILLLQRRWRTLGAALVYTAALSAPIAWTITSRMGGISRTISMVEHNLTFQDPRQELATSPTTRLDVGGLVHNAHLGDNTPLTFALMALAVVALIVVMLRCNPDDYLSAPVLSVCCLAVVIVTPNIVYAALALAPALVALTLRVLDRDGGNDARAGALTCLLLMLVPMVALPKVWRTLGLSDWVGYLFIDLCLAIAYVIAVVWALRRTHARRALPTD